MKETGVIWNIEADEIALVSFDVDEYEAQGVVTGTLYDDQLLILDSNRVGYPIPFDYFVKAWNHSFPKMPLTKEQIMVEHDGEHRKLANLDPEWEKDLYATVWVKYPDQGYDPVRIYDKPAFENGMYYGGHDQVTSEDEYYGPEPEALHTDGIFRGLYHKGDGALILLEDPKSVPVDKWKSGLEALGHPVNKIGYEKNIVNPIEWLNTDYQPITWNKQKMWDPELAPTVKQTHRIRDDWYGAVMTVDGSRMAVASDKNYAHDEAALYDLGLNIKQTQIQLFYRGLFDKKTGTLLHLSPPRYEGNEGYDPQNAEKYQQMWLNAAMESDVLVNRFGFLDEYEMRETITWEAHPVRFSTDGFFFNEETTEEGDWDPNRYRRPKVTEKFVNASVPCPVCGSEKIRRTAQGPRCTNCGAFYTGDIASRYSSKETWNYRRGEEEAWKTAEDIRNDLYESQGYDEDYRLAWQDYLSALNGWDKQLNPDWENEEEFRRGYEDGWNQELLEGLSRNPVEEYTEDVDEGIRRDKAIDREYDVRDPETGRLQWTASLIKTGNILDPIHETLDQRVFDDIEPRHDLFEGHITHIRETFRQRGYDPKAFSLYLTGSICTYQYSDTSDCDMTIVCDIEEFSPEDRAELVKIVTEHLDGGHFPGTEYPFQHFVQPPGVDIHNLFVTGLRSAYDFQKREWVLEPQRDRTVNIQAEYPDWFAEAIQVSEKMNTLIDAGNYDAAFDYYKVIHKRRAADQLQYGDISSGNVIYKFIINNGTIDRLRLVGYHIAT